MDTPGVFVDRVRERDLDNFLVEELQASRTFRSWFLSRLVESFIWPETARPRLRKSPPRPDGRQTDVELGAFDEGNQHVASVMIESKVTADFQPGQAEAYAVEVARRRAELGPSRACSVLIAPAFKLNVLDHLAHFDASISVEEIIDALKTRRLSAELNDEIDARLAMRIELLEAVCGKRLGSGWSASTVASKRDFAAAYDDLASLVAPRLSVNPTTAGVKSFTRFFSGMTGIDGLPPGVTVRLKHEFGSAVPIKYANLQFTGVPDPQASLSALQPLIAGSPFHLRASTSAVFVEASTPGLDPDIDKFEAQRPRIVEGLTKIVQLANWFEANACRLSTVLPVTSSSDTPFAAPSVEPPSSPSRKTLEAQLDAALRDLVRRSIKEFKYPPHDFVKLLDSHGAVATARRLLAAEPSRGFRALYERGGLSVTLEALVVQEPWRSSILFSREEIERAERRLREFRYIG